LICRVVTKLGNKPNSIIGDFVDYLLARHQSRILSIHIMRRLTRRVIFWSLINSLFAVDIIEASKVEFSGTQSGEIRFTCAVA